MSQQKSNGISFTVAILAGVVACVLGIFFAEHWQGANHNPVPGYEFVGTVLKDPRPVSNFNLTATDDKPFDNARLKGRWSFIFFGFTNCPKMCPTAMHELAQTYKLLQQKQVQPLPQIVMVSVDPARDSLSRMKSYVEGFNNSFIGAIGDDKKIRALSLEMGIAYEKIASRNSNEKSYDFQHSGAVIVVNPQGEIKAFFNWPHKPKDMAEDYSNLVS